MPLRIVPALFLLSQALNSQTPAADQPTIRITTRMVDVSVIARDQTGPVTGLTADDFQVFDNGEERTLAFFSVSTVRPPATRFTQPAPNVFTNRPEGRPDAASRLTVILVDSFNAAFEDQAKARQELLKYIARIQPRDRMAICVMGTSIRVLHDFTNNPRELEKAVDGYWGSLQQIPDSKAAVPGLLSGAGAFNAKVDAEVEEIMRSYRGRVTADLMKELGTQLARVPGRKSLIWLSTGFPIQLTANAPKQEYLSVPDLTLTARALAKGNVAVYPVDTAGLVPGGGGGGFANVGPGGPNRHHAMDLLAELTGGRAFYNRNDLDQEVREAVDNSEVTYTLGFYPGPAGQDGGYHRLQIQVGRPGVDLRYRQGYQAADAQIPLPELDGREQIRNALQSPVESTGISLNVRLEKPNPAKPKSMRITIASPLSDLTLAEQGGGTLDLIVGQRSADGRDVATLGDAVKVLRKEGLLLRREIVLRPDATVVRVIVFDRGSGRLGSIEIPAHP